MTAPIVIVGGGLAAGTAVTELREQGYDGDLVVLAGEAHVPYERPPLSKGYLTGEKAAESAYVHPSDWYADHGVDLRTGVRATGLDPEAHSVTAGGETLTWSRLLLATGSRPRRLALDPTDEVAVCYLRTLDDATAMRARLGAGRRLLVVGGGWIGMEVAASARQLGTQVTLVEPAEQPLLALGPEVDQWAGSTATLGDGTAIEVDTVVVGVGVVPDDELAKEAGLAVDDGVLVDAGLRASHPDVFAAGDIANAAHPLLAERVRVEHWQNAISQGRSAAHALVGEQVSFDELPYFFTDQFDLGMEYFGHVGRAGFDDLRIEGEDPESFACFWSRDGRLVAAMHVNQWDRSDELRDRVRSGG